MNMSFKHNLKEKIKSCPGGVDTFGWGMEWVGDGRGGGTCRSRPQAPVNVPGRQFYAFVNFQDLFSRV